MLNNYGERWEAPIPTDSALRYSEGDWTNWEGSTGQGDGSRWPFNGNGDEFVRRKW